MNDTNCQASESPNRDAAKHSFSDTYGPGGGPQETAENGAGYARLESKQVTRLLAIALREKNRQRRLKARRQRRWYHRNKLKQAPAKHPKVNERQVSAVEEAASLA